jgi:hypothetical protein
MQAAPARSPSNHLVDTKNHQDSFPYVTTGRKRLAAWLILPASPLAYDVPPLVLPGAVMPARPMAALQAPAQHASSLAGRPCPTIQYGKQSSRKATMVVRCQSTATVGFRDNLADARTGLGKKRPSMLIMENSPDDEQIGKQGHDRPSCLCSPSAYVCGHYYYLLYCCCVKPTVGPAYVCGQNAIRWRRKKPYIMRGTQEEARHITADCC